MNDNSSRLEQELQEYVTELDTMVAKIYSSGFPFRDVASIYEEVSARLKKIMEESKN